MYKHALALLAWPLLRSAGAEMQTNTPVYLHPGADS
jgi:hypothetical protein